MVSPQPLATLVHLSTSVGATSSTKIAPPLVVSPTWKKSPSITRTHPPQRAHPQATHQAHHQAAQHTSAGAPTAAMPAYPMPRMKRTTSFIASEQGQQPYIWSLFDDLPAHEVMPREINMSSLSLDQPSPISEATDDELFMRSHMPPMQYAFGEDLGRYKGLASYEVAKAQPCDQCWQQSAQCAECAQAEKEQQFDGGWPVDRPMLYDGQEAYLRSEYAAFPHDSWIKQEPTAVSLIQEPIGSDEPVEEKDELPLPESDHHARVQGKLTRFLPEGETMMAVDQVDPNYTTAFEAMPPLEQGRSLRVRRPTQRSRSPSPDWSDRSDSPNSFASSVDTDHYEPDDRMLDDSLSPPVVRYHDDAGSSDQSSSEPPTLVSLLPVSAHDLVPSRPSTAAIPPAHIKDRLVKSAKKLLTAADGVNDSVQVQVIPIWFPSKGAPSAHKIRLIRVENTQDHSVSVYAHAADVGGVVERKSNISRLFGKFESPSEKLLMNVVGAHNNVVGQESNILTSKGIAKFLGTNKMREASAYREWIQSTLMPQLLHDPLEIGEELLEIEASTDPDMPHHIKPKKMKRMEKKQQRKEQERKDEEQQQERQRQLLATAQKQLNKSTSPAPPILPSHLGSPAPTPKRQKFSHATSPLPQQMHSPPFHGATAAPFFFHPMATPFALAGRAVMPPHKPHPQPRTPAPLARPHCSLHTWLPLPRPRRIFPGTTAHGLF